MQDYFSLSMTTRDVNQISALGLAHCGDAVFELLVRSWLCLTGRARVENLHRATGQLCLRPSPGGARGPDAAAAERGGAGYYRRGRNAHVRQIPKNATHEQYAKATGLECLFGALYLTGQTAGQ